jgi:outer membrane protein
LLAVLEIPEMTSDIARAQATLQRAKTEVARGHDELQRAQAAHDMNHLAYERLEAVVKSKPGLVAQQEIDDEHSRDLQSEAQIAGAKLDLADAQNNLQSALAELASALDLPTTQTFQLAEEPLPEDLPKDLTSIIDVAIKQRPELAGLRPELGAAEHFAVAERDLNRPTIGALGAVGYVPAGQAPVSGRYRAAGVNINIPIFNGRFLNARQTEAEFHAKAAAQNVKDLENRVARDVRVAYLNAGNAHESLGLTAQLLEQAKLTLDLAQARYSLGLSSIVELSQAQLNETSAEIASTSAKYDYQTQRAILAYQAGSIR